MKTFLSRTKNCAWRSGRCSLDAGVARMLAEPEQISQEIFRKRWNSGGNIFAPRQTSTRQGTKNWQQALLRLAAEGLSDRERLIEYSFTALAGAAEKDSKKSIYGSSTADFAIQLNQELTKEKIIFYKSKFAALLGATHKDVSTYALTVLQSLPEKALSAGEICSFIQPAFLNKSKEPADAGLKLLSRLAKEQPAMRLQFGPAILAAFSHSSKDIHKKALALVEFSKILEEPELLSEFEQRLDMLTGIERTKAAELVAQYRERLGTSHDTTPSPVHSESIDELVRRAGKLENHLRSLARIDEAIEATKHKVRLDMPVQLDSLDFPRLNPNGAVKRIESFDDLVFNFMKVWSGKTNELEVEAVLDGVSRLCRERPEDFRQKTDALRQKADELSRTVPWFRQE